MKYILTGIFYFFMWIILGAYLMIERIAKGLSVGWLIVWHFNFKMEWQNRYDTILFIIPLPVCPVDGQRANTCPLWIINNYTDYFMMRNWDLFGEKHWA